MKKILLASICLFAGSVMAQELFPELAGLKQTGETEQVAEEIDVVMPDGVRSVGQTEDVAEVTEVVDVEQSDTPAEVSTESPEVNVAEEEPNPEEEEDDEEKIQIYMASIDSTITPNRNFSYCFGQIKFSTTTKKPVQALDVVITYGPYPSTYNIRNLVKDNEQAVAVTLVGDVCERIMDMPEMTVKRCVVEGMDEAKCKSKVSFTPLRGS